MSSMLGTQKNRNGTRHKFYQEVGGRHCVCCDNPPKWNKRMRRYMRRIEKQNWKKESE